MSRLNQNLESVRKSGTTSFSTTATPLTKIGDTSSANTTYTSTTVTDGSAWDLSAVSEQDIVVTEDGYKGRITAVDDGNDVLTVKEWLSPEGKQGAGVNPTDGQTATIHRIDNCSVMIAQADIANTDVVRIGLDGNARSDDFPLQAGMTVYLTPYCTAPNVDITKVYVLADSGNQSVAWIVVTL